MTKKRLETRLACLSVLSVCPSVACVSVWAAVRRLAAAVTPDNKQTANTAAQQQLKKKKVRNICRQTTNTQQGLRSVLLLVLFWSRL